MQSDKQSIRGVIVSLFPWLAGVVSVAGSAGKGLAIRPASGLLHLAGGPSDPAVHRRGDGGTAGTWGVGTVPDPPNPPIPSLTITTPGGRTIIITGLADPVTGIVTFTVVGSDLSTTQDTESTEGSEKVTCG